MRLCQKSRPCSISVFLLSFLLANYVAAQDLGVKLPGASSTTDTDTSSTATSSSTTDSSSTTSTISSSGSSASASSTDAAALTGLPKLAQDNYPAPTVPPTADAPFMQKSSLPDGTVFICVGAALGFIGALVLAWRGLVAWSLHRSVKRAAIAQSSKYSRVGDNRANNGKSAGPYFSPGPGSTLSLDHLAAGGKAGGKTSSSAHGSLFFSPTAGTGMQSPGNRGSSYLPAGYYAAGSSAPGGGSGMTHVGGGGIGLSNLAPQNHRYSRARSTGPSPPGSPSLPPSRGADSTLGRLSTAGLTMHASNSSLNLSAPPQGRAPSAYLEDLFENHPNTPPPEEHGRGRRF